MSDLAERLDGIRVRVRAPGVDLDAELSRRVHVALSFGASVYDFIDESALVRALTALARLLWAGWQRQYQTAVADTGLDIGVDDLHDQRFFAERAELAVIGRSADGRVTIHATGMRDFRVDIRPDTLRVLSEQEFSASVTTAATALIEDFRAQVAELKKRYYE